ncbi:MAG: DUF2905 domain-containing protein [Gemmatimonadota bacterium]|nr:MAG: DUF2905 domain-containing protein [Gemmatimonadota bacterium]
MMDISGFGKIILFAGLLLTLLGAALLLAGKVPFLGRLPGDIHIHKPGFSFHFPIMTCLILSVLLTVLLNIFLRR